MGGTGPGGINYGGAEGNWGSEASENSWDGWLPDLAPVQNLPQNRDMQEMEHDLGLTPRNMPSTNIDQNAQVFQSLPASEQRAELRQTARDAKANDEAIAAMEAAKTGILGHLTKGGMLGKFAVGVLGALGMTISAPVALSLLAATALGYAAVKSGVFAGGADGESISPEGEANATSVTVGSASGVSSRQASEMEPTGIDYQGIATSGQGEAPSIAENPIMNPTDPATMVESPTSQELFDTQLNALYEKLRSNVRSYPWMAQN